MTIINKANKSTVNLNSILFFVFIALSSQVCGQRNGNEPCENNFSQWMLLTYSKQDSTQNLGKVFYEFYKQGKVYNIEPIGLASDISDNHLITLFCGFEHVNTTKEFIQSDTLKSILQKTGATSKPQIKLLYIMDGTNDTSLPSNIMFVTIKIKNYNDWRKHFFASENYFLPFAGLKYKFTFHTIGDPNEITLMLLYSELKTAQDYSKTKEFKDLFSQGNNQEPLIRYIKFYDDEIKKNTMTDAQDTSSPPLNFNITSNADCVFSINDKKQRLLLTGDIYKFYLPIGKYSFSFKSTEYVGASYQRNIEVKDVKKSEVIRINIQDSIHKLVLKERSPKDSSNQSKDNQYDMVFVEGGTFSMGNNQGACDETPVHQVSVNSFYISKYEVTQNQWKEIMGDDPSHFIGCGNCPVENVSYDDALLFIDKLNKSTGLNYRLPSESEWEYASRGGKAAKGFVYSGSNNIMEVAWCHDNSAHESHPVGQKKPNELGLYDMSGNVFEWCNDIYGFSYQKGNNINTSSEEYRILRGGSWNSFIAELGVSARNKDESYNRGMKSGFRLAR